MQGLRRIIAAFSAQRLICISIRLSDFADTAVARGRAWSRNPKGYIMTQHLSALAIQDSPFARKLSAFVRLSPHDLTVMSDLYRRRRKFAVGVDMIHQGQLDQCAYVLASGINAAAATV